MLHFYFAAQFEHLAGAADAHAASFRDHQANFGCSSMHGLARGNADALLAADELHQVEVGNIQLRCIGRLLGVLHGVGFGFRRRRAERLLVIVLHVEADRFQHALDRRHVRRRATAEHNALHVVGRNQLHQPLVQVTAVTRPRLTQPVLLANDVQAEVGDARRHLFQLAVVNDVFRRTGAVDEHHVDVGIGVVEPARHRHYRGNTDTARQVQHLASREVDGVEQPHRAVHRQLGAFVHGVVEEVRHQATRHTLDGDREAVRHRWRAGNGV
ncbi:hypothetical protein D3C79_633460 [compost metagenome]